MDLTWYKGHLYQVADKLGNHLTLVYNKKLVPVPPTTDEELVEIGKELTVDTNGDGKPDRYGLDVELYRAVLLHPVHDGLRRLDHG